MLKNNKGVTLLELLIAIALLSLLIGPYFSHFITSTKIGERSERIVRAEFIAQKYLEMEKSNRTIPVSGVKKEQEDHFEIVITYNDKTDGINQSTRTLEIYDDSQEYDLIMRPDLNLSDSSIAFELAGGTELDETSDISFGGDLLLSLDEGTQPNEYFLSYQINGGTPTTLPGFPISTDDELAIKFLTPEIGITDKILDIELANLTSGDSEVTFVLFEYDDDNRNYEFSTSNLSIGDVSLFLKLTSDTDENIDNTLDYYWVNIEVIDSTGEVMAELHSSIRRE